MALENVGGIVRDLDKEARDWKAKQTLLRDVAIGQRRGQTDRICARYELESDEFYTAEQKAERYMA